MATHVIQASISDADLGVLVKCDLCAVHSLKPIADLAVAPHFGPRLSLTGKGANQIKSVVFLSTQYGNFSGLDW